MKRTLLKSLFCLTLCLAMMLTPMAGYFSHADGSHGFYMTCDAGVTDHMTDGFMIDFYSDSSEALYTYWSNANWSMYTLASSKKLGYMKMSGGGAYTGLQLRGNVNDRTGILSFWRYEYTDKKTKEQKYLYAEAVYGNTTKYDNEGSGTSCVMPYDWKNDQWYRQLLLCWDDEETGYTFVGTWYYDYEAEEWTLFAYYNTFLVDSYINGDIGQFLENYVESSRDKYRSFRYRNIYMLSHETDEWISSPKVSLRSDGNPKAHGEAKLGISDDGSYVWASVDGSSSVDTDHEISIKPVLKQDKKPTVGVPEIESFTLSGSELKWEMTDKSTPQLSYSVVVTDSSGKELQRYSGTRPEVASIKLKDLDTTDYKCELTVTDVFGKTASASYLSVDYGKDPATSPEPSDQSQQSVSDAPVSEQESALASPEVSGGSRDPEETETKNGLPWAVIVPVCAVVLVAGVGVCLVIVLKKKKK